MTAFTLTSLQTAEGRDTSPTPVLRRITTVGRRRQSRTSPMSNTVLLNVPGYLPLQVESRTGLGLGLLASYLMCPVHHLSFSFGSQRGRRESGSTTESPSKGATRLAPQGPETHSDTGLLSQLRTREGFGDPTSDSRVFTSSSDFTLPRNPYLHRGSHTRHCTTTVTDGGSSPEGGGSGVPGGTYVCPQCPFRNETKERFSNCSVRHPIFHEH